VVHYAASGKDMRFQRALFLYREPLFLYRKSSEIEDFWLPEMQSISGEKGASAPKRKLTLQHPKKEKMGAPATLRGEWQANQVPASPFSFPKEKVLQPKKKAHATTPEKRKNGCACYPTRRVAG